MAKCFSLILPSLLYSMLKFNKNDWNYIPNESDTPELKYTSFRNKPFPSDEILNLIGHKGVEKIDKKIKEMLQWRKVMYGKDAKQVDFGVGSLYFENKSFPEHRIWCHVANSVLDFKGKNTFTQHTIESAQSFHGYLLKWKAKVSSILDE